jgi:fatty-acyl-CoA synthase
MLGQMMPTQLTITAIMRHALRHHGDREIVSVVADAPLFRTTYRDVFRRASMLAHALADAGVSAGERVATLAWNDHRHLEIYYASSCAGMVLHTLNPRLFPEQIAWIVNHAEDRCLFVDPAILPLAEALAPRLPSVRHWIVLTDTANMPDTPLPGAVSYEAFIEGRAADYDWPDLHEDTACSICYTSGTTGDPKGVVYSHRSTVLHAMAACMADVMGLTQRDTVLPVVPMFHANAWGVPYAAPMVGAKLVMPGPKLADGEFLHRLMESEKVTLSLGVPTIWMALLQYLEAAGKTLTSLQRTIVGGAACPPAIMQAFRDRHGVATHHAWGMTETSPLGTFNSLKQGMDALPEPDQDDIRARQGRGIFGVELKIVGDDGAELPWDGKAFGTLKVRGPWVCSGYFRLDAGTSHDTEGWFDTGDVANIDPDGYIQITDRTKDVIKSGGEWISSIELENTAVAHADVAEAAVIGVAHERWTERPLLLIVPKPGKTVDGEGLRRWFRGKVADWWIPDDVLVVDELPHTATGKLNKLALREAYADHKLPGSDPS